MYQITKEPLTEELIKEVEPLTKRNGEVMEGIPFKTDMDWDQLMILQGAGCLIGITARDEGGNLGGYLSAVVHNSLNHKGRRVAAELGLFVDPDFTDGWTGYKLLKGLLAEDNVDFNLVGIPPGNRASIFLKRLGFKPVEVVYGRKGGAWARHQRQQ